MLLAMRRASSSVSTLALVRVALAEGQLVPFAGIGAEVFGESVGHVHKGVSGGAGFFFVMLGQTAEYWRLMSSHFSRPGSVSGLIASTRAFRLANAAIDAFVRVDDEHVLALVETVHRTYLDAVRVLAANATLVDDAGHPRPLVSA